ncbi:MAG: GldG family protein [Verrucomicrobiales bacterium]|nr:GldG family protein [Verrucomicrobiales bacterium]
MSKSNQFTSRATHRRNTALIGLAVVFVILLLINFLAGKMSLRADLTEYNTYTLSEGTENILNELDTPVVVRFYVTDDSKVMSPGERTRVRRVEDMLNEFVREAPAKEIELTNEDGEFETQKVRMLTVEKLNPEPNTDAEDSAIIDGLEAGMSGETNNEVFFGIAVKCLDQSEVIPFVPARPETMLEYDLARAISSVHGGKDKKITVMTSMSVGGGFGGNFQAPPQQAWMFYEQLGRDYEIETIPSTSAEIPEDTATLIIVHPHDITDEAQFAVDQYLLKGGNVMVLVDPNFFYSRALAQGQPQMPGMPPQGGPAPTSDLNKLFSAWGVKYDPNRVLADLDFGSEIIRRGNFAPTFLTLDRNALGSEPSDPGLTDPMTNMLNQLNMLTPGAFEINPPEGLEVDRLVLSSENNQLVGSFDADPTQEGSADRIRENFESSGQRRALVARLTGEFKTAFPEGDPAKADEEDKEESADDAKKDGEEKADETREEKTDDSLKESVAPGRVLLIADVDFIYDANVVRRQQIPGLNIVIPEMLNENLTLLQNAAEQMSGDPDLIKVRSRTTVRRPFTRQNEWYQAAQEKYAVEVKDFREKAKAAETRLNEILSQTPENIDQALLSPEVQNEMKKLQEEEIQFRKRERELQKEVTREFRRKLSTYKFGNALLMPLVVILFGIGLAIFRRKRVAAR